MNEAVKAAEPRLGLNNGIDMPTLGLGVYQSGPEETAAAATAIADGYRLIGHGACCFRVAKDVDHVDGFADIGEPFIDTLAIQHRAGEVRVDRDHAIAATLQETHHAV